MRLYLAALSVALRAVVQDAGPYGCTGFSLYVQGPLSGESAQAVRGRAVQARPRGTG